MKKQIENGIITYTFADAACPAIVFDTARANDARKASAIICGFAATLTDAAALPRVGAGGQAITITEKMRYDAVKARAEFLMNDEAGWTQRTERAPAVDPFIVAMAEKLGITTEEARAKIQATFLADLA